MSRRTQHRHRCVDNRVVLNRIAATVPMMEGDKDDSNDSQNGGVYSTMTCNERAPGKGCSSHAYDATCAAQMMSDCLDSKSRTVRQHHLANVNTMRLQGLQPRGQNSNDSRDPTIVILGIRSSLKNGHACRKDTARVLKNLTTTDSHKFI